MNVPPPVVNPNPLPPSPFDMEAKKRLQRQGVLKMLFGFLGQFTSLIAMADPENMALMVLALVLRLGFLVLFIWGCCDYMRSKGYSWGWGFLGLLGCIGLIILAVMPDKWKPEPPSQWPTNYPRHPGA